MSDFEKWETAVSNLREALWAERRIIVAFLAGWLLSAVVLATIWLIAPERFC